MELNPNHGVTQEAHDNWHKVVALLMLKMGKTHVEITMDDVLLLQQGMCVVFEPINDVIHLRLIGLEEANKLAKAAGGLPV